MISRVEGFLRYIRRLFSRTEWAIWLLRLPKLKERSSQPGLVMAQIDGFSFVQFNRALKQGNIPFLRHLLQKEHYVQHSFYSGLPSNTPAVQAELFYGVKGCVPSFSFVDHELKRAIRMDDSPYVQGFEERLKEQDPGLLTGGSAYSNIFAGGAGEAHCCFGKMGWEGVRHAVSPLVFPFLVILYLDIFLRAFALFTIELFLAIAECLRGTLKGRLFRRELEMLWLRTLVCVLLREFVVAGACMDIRRGLPVVHLNFLGYDEQSHCRGPSSRFAHWALQGIDHAIRRVNGVIKESPFRQYDLWVYSDHGQSKTTPYLIKYGRTVEEVVGKIFEPAGIQVTTAAIGPVGQIYIQQKQTPEAMEAYARQLVFEAKIPLVLHKSASGTIAHTPRGNFAMPGQIDEIFGKDHPFLGELKEDLPRICAHPDAGDFVIAGWSLGEEAISFPLEYGAHAGMGVEETGAFALLPVDAPVDAGTKDYIRPMDLREAARRFLNKEGAHPLPAAAHTPSKGLRLMSYNVHGCLGIDGFISTERIARVIARHKPDVIALQELDSNRARSGGMNQAERIARKLEMQYHFHSVFTWKDGEYGNAILSHYPMALMKMDALPQMAAPKPTELRGALWVAVEFQGMKVQIFNTHLSLWAKERVLQAEALVSAQWLRHPDCQGPAILCGDFNAPPGSTSYRKIHSFLKDSQKMRAGQRRHNTWMGRYPLTSIDHIFVTADLQVHSISAPRTSLEKMASDHLPLIADLHF